MDYAELANRLRKPLLYGGNTLLAINAKTMLEAADAIEALTSPPDEAQVDEFVNNFQPQEGNATTTNIAYLRERVYRGLNAAYRIRVKKEAKA